MLIEVLASMYCDAVLPSGKPMDCSLPSAAHRTLPLGSCIEVKTSSNRSLKLLINDRGPCTSEWCKTNRPDILKRELDISTGAAKLLAFSGLGKLKFKIVEC